VNVSVNASATPFQQPSGYGSHGYSTGKRPDRASCSAAVTDGGGARSQSHWWSKGTAVMLLQQEGRKMATVPLAGHLIPLGKAQACSTSKSRAGLKSTEHFAPSSVPSGQVAEASGSCRRA